MEAEEGGENARQLGDVHGSNGGILRNKTPDFEEIIRGVDEAIQYDPRISNSKKKSQISCGLD